MQFMGHKEDCATCPLRSQCLRSSKQKESRQFSVKLEHVATNKDGPLERMKQKINSKAATFTASDLVSWNPFSVICAKRWELNASLSEAKVRSMANGSS